MALLSCDAGVNILDFVAFMEDVDIRQAGLLIKKWFKIASREHKKLAKEKEKRKKVEIGTEIENKKKEENEKVNRPLTLAEVSGRIFIVDKLHLILLTKSCKVVLLSIYLTFFFPH